MDTNSWLGVAFIVAFLIVAAVIIGRDYRAEDAELTDSEITGGRWHRSDDSPRLWG
jgi:hypothetical protein